MHQIDERMFRKLAVPLLFAGFCFSRSLTPDEAIDRYLAGARDSQSGCSDWVFAVQIDASLPELRKQGSMSGQKVVSRTGRTVYRGLRFTGDNLVKTAVIARFLANDAKPPERVAGTDVTRQNYSFVYDRKSDYNGLVAYVFRLKPMRMRKGLFQGELWSMRPPPLPCGYGAISSNRRRFLSGPFALYRTISGLAVVSRPSVCCSRLRRE